VKVDQPSLTDEELGGIALTSVAVCGVPDLGVAG